MSAEVNMGAEAIPRWPRIEAVAREDGTGEVIVNGTSHPVTAASLDEVRIAIIRLVAETAGKLGRPVRVSTSGPDGYWPLIVHPDGNVTADENDQPRPGRRSPAAERPAPQPFGAAAAAESPETEVGHETGRSAEPDWSEPQSGAESFQPAASAASVDDHGEGATSGPPQGDAGDAYAGQSSTSAPQAEPEDSRGHQPYSGQPYASQPDAARSSGQPVTRPTRGRPSGAQVPAAPRPAGPAMPYVPGRGMTAPAGGATWQHGHESAQQAEPSSPGRDAVGRPTGGTPTAQANQPSQRTNAPGTDPETAEPAARRQSFLTLEQVEEPATKGFRGFLSRAGLRMSPNESERSERADMQAVSQHWPGPRTISVVNGKGGAGKTPTTVLLSAVFAYFGGAGVVAWDNNQTRGTLGWRTEQGQHEATLLDLLPQIPRLLGTGAQSADLAHFVHHQTRDRFDVLRSKPMVLAHEQRVSPQDVDAIHAVLGKYYRLIFIDSGNDESDPMWLRMVDHSDQLVVATTTRDDHAEAGALLLEALAERDERSAGLARNSVAIVTQADPAARPSEIRRVASGYQSLTRATVTIPFDPVMVDGLLRYGSLRPETKRAWLAAAAAVARGL